MTFEPLASLSSGAEQLHLAHPVVRRILDRFLAQGFGANDLSRICAVVVPGENVSRVIGYARLTLFGRGAARLHDELIAVAAAWTPGQEQAITPYRDSATAARARETTEHALASGGQSLPEKMAERVIAATPQLYADLWPVLQAEADRLGIDAKNGLARRARKESEDLAILLKRQRTAIGSASADLRQFTLFDVADKQQKRQVELDIAHLAEREAQIEQEVIDEPAAIAALYEVQMTRLSPVGLVIAWPESMT